MKRVAKTGNEAIAEAMKQINPDVCAAYPITPATEVMQIFAQFVANGEVATELVTTESEHSAISACIGASAAGARVITATSSQGLALMYEMLYIAAGLRLPIVLVDANRSLSAPINIHCDHTDTMGARDSGWIQIFSENAGESYDNMFMAVRIAEKLLISTMVTLDGFIITHGMETLEIQDTDKVKEFIGEYKPAFSLLDISKKITVGGFDLQDYFFEHKRSQIETMNNSLPVIKEIIDEYNKKFKRAYGIIEEYSLADAEIGIILLGSTAGTAKVVVDELREKGIKAGLLKIRFFRPFPISDIISAIKNLKAIAVLDRSEGLAGTGGPLFTEIKSSLYEAQPKPFIINYIYGLGGRSIDEDDIKKVYNDLENIVKNKMGLSPFLGTVPKLINYLGVRE